MIVVYESNTGYTKQYAEMLAQELGVSAFALKEVPGYHKGSDAIFLGWLMAEKVYGYAKAKKFLNIKGLVGVGMSPESAEMDERIREKNKVAPLIPVFYLQGGYDFKKLKGPFKAIMAIKGKEIISRFDGKSEEEKKANATYRMVTEGYSVVSMERLQRVVDAFK